MLSHAAKNSSNQDRAAASSSSRMAKTDKARGGRIGARSDARTPSGVHDLINSGPQATRAAQLQAMVDGSAPVTAQRQRMDRGLGSGAAVLQGLFLPQAQRDIEEDQMTLKEEWFRARDESRTEDKELIAQKQTETAVRPEAIMALPTPEERKQILKEELNGNKYAIRLFEAGASMELCRDVVANMNRALNPMLPFDLLMTLREDGWLLLEAVKFRESVGGQNGMIYYLSLQGSLGFAIGEWHVHWESGNKAGSPGWKRGKNGEKTPTGDEMKRLLGDRWGVVTGSGGGYF